MKDRAMQALYWLALDPVAETLADPNSYGFRKGRSCADAAGQLFIQQSRKSSPQWVLDADISGCFDNISHEWLLANIPMDKAMLKKWLKAGYLEKQRLFPTATGTPQGGILSPTLANMTLDGLERCIEVGLQPVRKAMDGKPKVHLVRYADDFVITADQHWLAMKAKQEVEQFLQERGLKLSLEKTRCVSIGEGYDFLGWNFRKYEGTLLIKPAAKNVKHHLRKVRDIINGSGALSQETLIKRLNPMIRGWSNYHAGQASKETYGKLDHYLWKALWKWARRRHPSKGRRWIVKRHWHHEGNRNWVFGARTKDGERRFIKLHTYSETPIRRHIKIKGKANPYDPAWEEYFEQRETNAMKLTLTGRVKRLWTRQEGHCPNCQQLIKTDEEWAVHHKIPKSLGGRDTLENLQLLHGNCHRQVHAQHKLSELPAL